MAEKILVLEPEPVYLRYICRVLWKVGYSVLEAHTCEAAIRLGAENNGSIPLFIADVGVGDHCGIATAQLLREVWPDMAVLLTTALPVEYWPRLTISRLQNWAEPFFWTNRSSYRRCGEWLKSWWAPHHSWKPLPASVVSA